MNSQYISAEQAREIVNVKQAAFDAAAKVEADLLMPKIFNQIEETANQRLRVTQLYIKNEVMPFVKIELEKLGYILRPGDCKAAAVSLIIISW